MTSLADLLQQGAGHAWLFVPTAILLGALHGLEPGHSKTMMAAFIIAIRGSVAQAVMLGLAAALSHTAVVWVVALGGQYFGRGVSGETVEPYLQLASGGIVACIALWMIWRTHRDITRAERGHDHDHDHAHHHDHPHDHEHHHHHHDDDAWAELEAQDAHERAHAEDIRRRFEGRQVSTGQIVLFGLTGGLIPCPAAITVLLLCLQLHRLSLGVVLVGGFSIGLAITMVSAGVLAALSVAQAQKHWRGFGALAQRAPYASGALMLVIAGFMAAAGWRGLGG